MTRTRYPCINDFSLAVLLAAAPGAKITPATVDMALARYGKPYVAVFTQGHTTFEEVHADLARAHMIDEDDHMTPLADRYASFWHRFLAKTPRPK